MCTSDSPSTCTEWVKLSWLVQVTVLPVDTWILDGAIEGVGHVGQVGDGEQGDTPAERWGVGGKGARCKVRADDERRQVGDQKRRRREGIQGTTERHGAPQTSLRPSFASGSAQAL